MCGNHQHVEVAEVLRLDERQREWSERRRPVRNTRE